MNLDKNMLIMLMGLVSLALMVSAISTEHWGDAPKSGDGKASLSGHSGLWKACVKAADEEKCVDLPPADNKEYKKNALEAVRALSIVGAVLLALALVCSHLSPKHAPLLMLGGGVLSLVSVVVYAAELRKPVRHNDAKVDYGYSYYLALGGGVLGVIAGGISLAQ